MTLRRRAEARAAMDARTNALVAPLLAELRGDLLIAPVEQLAVAHIEQMRLERDFVARPAPARRRRTRPVVTRPRRAQCVVAAVTLAFASCGLDAVGALPRPLQDISNTIKHSLGIAVQLPHLTEPSRKSSEGAVGSPNGVAGSDSLGAPSSTAPSTQPGGARPATGAPVTTGSSASSPSTPGSTGGPQGPNPVAAPPTSPPQEPMPVPPPHKYRGKEPGPPPGLPGDWQTTAVSLAIARLQQCTGAITLEPVGCPQHATLNAPRAAPGSVSWRLVGPPLAGAVATVDVPLSEPSSGAGSRVTVYGRFAMIASYRLPGVAAQYNAYSGGIAQATMTWNGSLFPKVTFVPEFDALPPGVSVAPFTRPDSISDANVLATVRVGFQSCAASTPSPVDASVPNCPQHTAAHAHESNAEWRLTGDPTRGATVSFDSLHGNFTVTGTYTMTLTYKGSDPQTVTGEYTATLAFVGNRLRLVCISGS